jgi:hypothetical protein
MLSRAGFLSHEFWPRRESNKPMGGKPDGSEVYPGRNHIGDSDFADFGHSN